ncbi:YfiH family protein [Sedimentibacter acidaminivorans]|uniref:Purine nucleoside phosphorylase n=1 Tax=Sedimentibacter acidaminivorans TaxID=913099 RepID=A0ABS4GDX3_9FIRM|nr:peptidoglycan editing factor PgeF [Sedimentibacter acidaminivorans]MBP1925901.1 YfiH family protein [Sedimentibacter acidaminivorans]
MYKINKKDNFKYLTFSSLEKYPSLFHCFTTRLGGVSEGCFSSMNLGMSTDDKREHIVRNYEILSKRLSLDLYDMVKTCQTHTSNIRYATDEDKGKIYHETPGYKDIDGLITDKQNIILSTSHADCTPIFFYDPVKKVIGMAHAGWRGTIKNISGNMIRKFVEDFNSNTKDIIAVIGPSLGQCCFEVDKDVAEIILSENKDYLQFMEVRGIKYHFDLWAINKYILLNEGLKQENIEISGLCTKCNNDLFFSHRGQKGKRGLMSGIIMMK